MNRFCGLLVTLLIIIFGNNGQTKAQQPDDVLHGLKVSKNQHYLVDALTGKPVFILATTAWNINALTYNEIDTLLQSAAHNGFNCLMFALNFYPQADEPNIYGEKPYVGPEKTDLNPAYLKYCDDLINKCARYGIYPMVYTMWSGKTTGTMNTYSPEQLYTLGKKIGNHFKQYRNVILVAGGESSPPYIDTIRVDAIGRGLKESCGNNNLVSVHPCAPHSNSEYFKGCAWLDFYMSQAKSNLSGITFDLTKAVSKDYQLSIKKPTIVAEHRYESGTNEDPIIQRRSLYLSVFAGGFGYAYGHNALWQMTPHTGQPWMLKSWKAGVGSWKEALNTPAQQQLQYIKRLLYAFPYLQRVPDQSLLLSAHQDSVNRKVEIMRDGETNKNDATYILTYISAPQAISIKTDVIKANKLNIYWFDPQTGKSEIIAKQWNNTGSYSLGKSSDTVDGVLAISDVSKNYRLP